MRIGMGYDVHRLTEGRDLILGGVRIPYEKGLLGHSDADVLLHAIMDAMLGAAALGWEPRPWEISGSIFRIQIRPIKGFQASGFWSMWESSSKKSGKRWGISTLPSSPRGRRLRLISRLCVRPWPELLE